MIKDEERHRSLKTVKPEADLVVVGGGLSGVCCAITAAREGLRVALVQDRPVLGGNASSEVRLWVLGATSHMGNNNRWAREGGVIDELLVENMYRNPEGNPMILDTILLEKVVEEPNIRLFLNTSVYEVHKKDENTIESAVGFCSQNQTKYIFHAPLFCDASGDGIIGFLAGAAFRMGAESADEFGELFAPSSSYGELLGHSLYFYSKDIGRPVIYVAPSFALKDITEIPRHKSFNATDQGCRLWWIEYGGRLDTIHDTEKIKWELWRIVYGVWDHIKNSGLFPEAESYALEWVGTIPGKRESRRFEGDYMLTQQDLVEQRPHDDAVAYGGWSIDLHPADGVFSEMPGCNQWHCKGIYAIPYRCLYSRNLSNLFLSGRLISASHVAFGSTRVMATAAYAAQAVGMAAAIAAERNVNPGGVGQHIGELQKRLIRGGQFIPGITTADEADLVQEASLLSSSEYNLSQLPEDNGLLTLTEGFAQMIPVQAQQIPELYIHIHAHQSTSINIELCQSSRRGSFTPDHLLEEKRFALTPGKNCIQLSFSQEISEPQYLFLIFRKNEHAAIYLTTRRLTGILSLYQTKNKAVSNEGVQIPPPNIGIDQFEFWTPKRRPGGFNMALSFTEPLQVFSVANIRNGPARPLYGPNAWVADLNDAKPEVRIQWKEKKKVKTIMLSFDTDLDHPMESVLQGHPENVMPFCVRNYTVYATGRKLLFEKKDNYQTRNVIKLQEPVETNELILQVEHPSKDVPAAVFEIRVYE
jgi:hypothetical protein